MKFVTAFLFLLFFHDIALSENRKPDSPTTFSVATVNFEQNATDGDVEVVFKVKGSKEGLAKLAVISPDGRTIIDFTAPESSTLGIRQFEFESPEPTDVKKLKDAYPEGIYRFTGTSVVGVKYLSESSLSHKLPIIAAFDQPKAGAKNVDIKDLKINWISTANASAYIIVIKQDDLDVKIKTRLNGSTTSFIVPNGFLQPNTEYQLEIGTLSGEGNISYVETIFSTKKM